VALELVLVDNGSRDRTGEVIDDLIAQGLPIVKVVLPENKGYGHGILSGLTQCRAPLAGYLCADGQVAPDDVVRVYQLMAGREGRIIAKVRRRFRQDSWRRKIVSICYNALMIGSFGWVGAIDINGSPKIFARAWLRRLHLSSRDWFLDPELMIKARALGLRTIEIDVEGYPRSHGASHVQASTIGEFLKNMAAYRFGPVLRQWKRTVAAEAQREGADGGARLRRAAAVPAGSAAARLDAVRVLPQRRFEDARGYLQKVLSASQCDGPPPGGEVYVTAARPGEVKGNHLHHFMGEWFSVVQGAARVAICDPESGYRRELELSAAHPCAIYVPPGLAHAVVNDGDEMMICVAWAEAEHDPADVFPYTVWPRPRAEWPVAVDVPA